MKPMNLLIIMADELSVRTLGCYGHPMVKTPNIDRLAASGVRFTGAYTNSPICTAARARRVIRITIWTSPRRRARGSRTTRKNTETHGNPG